MKSNDNELDKELQFFETSVNKAQGIAIIGGAGHVGSVLTKYFENQGRDVTVLDLLMGNHSSEMSADEVQSFATIIFLGGCRDEKTCSKLDETSRHVVQVRDLIDLINKMNRLQHLITVSSAEIMEGNLDAKEPDNVSIDLLNNYSKSMYNRELALREVSSKEIPKISILRLGHVVGVSPRPHTDRLVLHLFKSAYTSGVLDVHNVNAVQSFLWSQDLCRAVEAIILNINHCNLSSTRFLRCVNVWHLESFNARVLKVATSIAAITGARLEVKGFTNQSGQVMEPFLTPSGFSLNCESFKQEFAFDFKGTLDMVLSEIDNHVPSSITDSRITDGDSHTKRVFAPCPVCGSTESQFVLNLGIQDHQTHGQNTLLRCRRCSHLHLSEKMIPEPFDKSKEQKVTEKTSIDNRHSRSIFSKIQKGSGYNKSGSLMEFVLSNETNVAKKFRDVGWNVYSVASPLYHPSRLWRGPFDKTTEEMSLTVILINNVISHVRNPVFLLKECAKLMGIETKLYIKLPYCGLIDFDKRDWIFSGQLSIFTGHSLVRAAEHANLDILRIEQTPKGGEGCLVTVGLRSTSKARSKKQSIDALIEQERQQGLTNGFLVEKFRTYFSLMRGWMASRIKKLRGEGFSIVVYGTDLTGFRCLCHILGGTEKSGTHLILDYVMTEARVDVNCSHFGTGIPLQTSINFTNSPGTKGLLIIEMPSSERERIDLRLLDNHGSIFVLKPFPYPRIVKLGTNEVMESFSYNPTRIPNPLRDKKRKKVTLHSHIRNEAFLLPYFIIHHAHMFDAAVLVDFLSDDETLGMIEEYAPSSWQIVNSSTGGIFDLVSTDQQISRHETMRPNDWAIVLTIPEFLIHPNLRLKLWNLNEEREGMHILQLTRLEMVGNDTMPLSYFSSLPKQRYVFTEFFTNRYLHFGSQQTYGYKTGRHRLVLINGTKCSPKCFFPPYTGGFVMAYAFTPWPEAAARKLAVGRGFPKSDVMNRRGFQHTERMLGGMKYLEKERQKTLSGPLHSLCSQSSMQFLEYRRAFMDEFQDAC